MFLRAEPWMVFAPALLWLAGCAAVEPKTVSRLRETETPTTPETPSGRESISQSNLDHAKVIAAKPTSEPVIADKPAPVAALVAAVEPQPISASPPATTPSPEKAAPPEETDRVESLFREPVTEPAAKLEPVKPAPSKKARVQTTSTKKVPRALKQELDWDAHLTAATSQLESATAHRPTTNGEVAQHIALRMLYLMAGRRDEAVQPIPGIPAVQQDFWSHEFAGLATYLDTDQIPEANRRAADASKALHDAAAQLDELAALQVRNSTFCSEVTSYGVYEPFATCEFQAGQELLLYAELENFKSEQTERGYHTALKAAYQLLDEQGQRVDAKDFALTEEYCRNSRRDFFVRYFVWLPKGIEPGAYKLQLSVEDTLSQKLGEATIEFKVVAEKRDATQAYPISPK
jgi:hypothetical protein